MSVTLGVEMAGEDPFAQSLAAALNEHPDIDVDIDEFRRWVADRAPSETARGRLHVADLLVAYGCLQRSKGALSVFERSFVPVLAAAVKGAGAGAHDVDEAVQRIRERLLVSAPGREAKIAGYRGDGPLRGWLRVCAVREVLSERRKRHPEELPADDALARVLDADPELELIKANAAAEFRAAFSETLAELPARGKNVLRYCALDGLTMDDVARIYRVDRSTVSRWVAKARQRLLDGTRRRLKVKLRIDRAQFDSLMDLIASRLDLSLGELRRESDD